MKKTSIVLMLIGITLFTACSKKNSASKAPKIIPTTYATNIAPLLQAKCSPCHIPSKGGNKANFENYESAKKFGAGILARVQLNPGERGFMPMRKEKLSVEEIAVIKKWNEEGLLEK